MIQNKLKILAILFLVPALFAFVKIESPPVQKTAKLTDYLSDIDGYTVTNVTPLGDDIYRFLDLDDFTFTTYQKGGDQVTLYIGYYYTADKVSAAHSPLVCFPGQGWTIDEPEYGRHAVGDHLIHYARINASLGSQKEMVVYWYQSHDTTTPHVYRNKINTFYNKIVNDDQQHAFVRVSTPLGNGDPQVAQQRIADFMEGFYPLFLEFITHDNRGV